jgi:hypothetical protein
MFWFARRKRTALIYPQFVSIFLILVTSGFHYTVQHITYRTDLQRVQRFIKEAQLAAWGPKLIPIEGQRKVRFLLNGIELPLSALRWTGQGQFGRLSV